MSEKDKFTQYFREAQKTKIGTAVPILKQLSQVLIDKAR